MNEEQNLRTVQEVFAAFGSGNLPAMLALMSEDIEWQVKGPSVVPYAGERRGHAGVNDFFTQLGGAVEFSRFETQEFIAQGEQVVVLGSETARVRSTGRSFDNDWAIVFTFDAAKIARVRIYEDTHALAEAFRA